MTAAGRIRQLRLRRAILLPFTVGNLLFAISNGITGGVFWIVSLAVAVMCAAEIFNWTRAINRLSGLEVPNVSRPGTPTSADREGPPR